MATVEIAIHSSKLYYMAAKTFVNISLATAGIASVILTSTPKVQNNIPNYLKQLKPSKFSFKIKRYFV